MRAAVDRSAENKLYGLDHLRALAITLVFLFHYQSFFKHSDWMESVASFGWVGVDLFFVLSGYLIAAQLFSRVDSGKSISVKEFYLKRFFRIIPAYLFVVLIYFSLPSLREKEALPPLWRFLTFTQNFGLNPKDFGTFSHAWSLCVEEQFYLLLPLTILVCLYFKVGKRSMYLIAALFIFGFVSRVISWNSFVQPGIASGTFRLPYYKWVYYPTYNRLDGLLVGIGVAGLFQFYPQIKNRIGAYGNRLLLIGLALLTGAYFLCQDQFSFAASVFGFPVVSIGFGCVVAGAVLPSSFLYKYKSVFTFNIAALSYSIYLSHKMTIHVMQQQSGTLGIAATGTLMLVLCMLASWVVALLLRMLIEKPFLKLRDIVLKRNRIPRTTTISPIPEVIAINTKEKMQQ
jgi:peptidoglycan/LPS O-acetylase OafA/YrhL